MIFGWDCSAWDYDRGSVDLAAAVRDGISFVTAKATEGRSFVDSRYAQTAGKARGVVPLFGAYHVLHPAQISPITAQVDHFLAVLDGQSPWWRGGPFLVQLDCERWSAGDFPQRGDIAAWCDQFVARTGGGWQPVVYASAGQYAGTLAGLGRPLWNANYGTNPVAHYRQRYAGDGWPGWSPYSGAVAAIGQYGSQLTIGSQPGCDANAFRGSLQELLNLIGGNMAAIDDVAGRVAWMDPRVEGMAKLIPPTTGAEKGTDLPFVAAVRRIDAGVAGLTATIAALSAAVHALAAGGTSIDTAAVLAAVAAAGDTESAAVSALHDQVAALHAQLSAAAQAEAAAIATPQG